MLFIVCFHLSLLSTHCNVVSVPITPVKTALFRVTSDSMLSSIIAPLGILAAFDKVQASPPCSLEHFLHWASGKSDLVFFPLTSLSTSHSFAYSSSWAWSLNVGVSRALTWAPLSSPSTSIPLVISSSLRALHTSRMLWLHLFFYPWPLLWTPCLLDFFTGLCHRYLELHMSKTELFLPTCSFPPPWKPVLPQIFCLSVNSNLSPSCSFQTSRNHSWFFFFISVSYSFHQHIAQIYVPHDPNAPPSPGYHLI